MEYPKIWVDVDLWGLMLKPGFSRHFSVDLRGTAMIEFAIVGPIFFFLLLAILGVGLDGFYQVTLDDAVRDAARQLQIDGPAATSKANFVGAVCTEFGVLANGCTSTMTYSVQASTSTITPFGSITPAVLSSAGKFPNNNTFSGNYADNLSILVQVAYPLPFVLPYVGSLITNTGTGSIVTETTVRTEPF